MNKLETFLSQELTQALGWTIVHSLWQAALVALALSALLIVLNRHSAQVRYFVSVTALFTTLGLAVFTFFSLYQQPTALGVSETAGTFSASTPTVLAAGEQGVTWFSGIPFRSFFEVYFEKHLPLIVTFWFMGMLVMALKMLGSLAYVQRLKNYQTQPLGTKWQQQLTGLQEKLAFTKPVRLLESVRVKVPVAIGYLKPVILMPLGAINGLSEKQVEAILAHELAHIYRHDYIFNLVQTVIETIFFYHPAMWWIGANVRAERENCCDDIALNLCGDPLAFANALAELEEMTYTQNPALAMAFNGKRGSLLGRIKRLVNQPKRRPSFSEGFIAACFLMVSISAISLNAMAQLTPDFEEFPYYIGSIKTVGPEAEKVQPAETVFASRGTWEKETKNPVPAEPEKPKDYTSDDYSLSVSVAPDQDGKDIIIVKDKKGNVVEMFVDGKKVRKKDIPEFERIIAGREGKKDKKKKQYASKADLEDARQTLREINRNAPQPQVYIYGNPAPQPRMYQRYRVQAAPAPPFPGAAPLAPPAPEAPGAPPVPPMKPMSPAPPAPPTGKTSEAKQKAYEQEMKAYEKELEAYEKRNDAAWKTYEKDMERFSEDMEEYSKEMAEFGKEISRSVTKQLRGVYAIEVPKDIDEEREHIIIRQSDIQIAHEEASKTREEALRHATVARERAAREREKQMEIRAKEREKAAEVRAKAAKERNERMDKLKAELRKDKLIGEKDKNLSYRISNDGLYVNGKKQPQATFEKYKKLFHPGLKEGSKYNEVYNINED